MPAHSARHRTANGIRAGHIHRHSRLRGPRQARLVLRARAAQQAVRHVDIVGVRVAAGQQEAEEPLIFSCNCLARSRNRWGEYYARCRDRGMPHGKALKAVARKRLKVIYAIMRDKVPYAA